MIDRKSPHQTGDFVKDARLELSDMLRDGIAHPSSKRVLAAGAAGAVAGAVLPFVSAGLGLAAGAGYVFYKRIRPD